MANRLPLYRLTACSQCGYAKQGTRAKGGNSTRCRICGTQRRVPVDRPVNGPDDPRAESPRRGQPFKGGNPYQITPSKRLPGKPRTKPLRLKPYQPYRPCEQCMNDRRKTADGRYNAAVMRVELWDKGQEQGIAYVCQNCLVQAQTYVQDRNELAGRPVARLVVLDRP